MIPFASSAMAAESGGMPQFDSSTYVSQVFWLAIAVVVLFFLLSRLVIPRVSDIVATRQQVIEGDLARAEELQKRAEALQSQIAERQAEAQVRAQEIRAEGLARTQEIIAAETARAEVRITELTKAGEERIRDIRRAAIADVEAVAREVAGAIAEEVLDGPVNSDAVEAAVRVRLEANGALPA